VLFVSFTALTLVVGWQHLPLKNPVPLILRGSHPEQVEEDSRRKMADPGSPG